MNKTQSTPPLKNIPEPLLSGPEWLADSRKTSRQLYNEREPPLRTAHLWKYTDPKLFALNGAPEAATAPPAPAPSVTLAQEQLQSGELSVYVYERAGVTPEIHIGATQGADKVTIMSLKQAADEGFEPLRLHLGSAVGANFGKFEALNSALWQDGVLIYLPKGVQLTAPIHLLRRGAADEGWWYGRTLIVAEEQSAITVIDEYFSADDTTAGKSNHVVEIIGAENSDIQYVAIQRNNAHSLSYLTQRTKLADRAKVTLVAATLGGSIHKSNLGTILEGRDAQSLQYGLVFGSDKQQLDHHTEHIHRGANGYSNLDFKVVLKDKAKSAYTGLIRVDEHVENCEAYQSNRNLLLNRGASAESIPELEILCDEVVCTHGATVGPIDEMQLFYLMNRGIPRNEAVKMIVRGHVEPTLALLPETVRPRVREHVDARLETL